MKRKIIKIDREKCNGCGICADACHEGAIKIEAGKAMLIKDDYCDGLGDCLPACPLDAISFEEREAAPYDKEAVEKRMKLKAHGKNQIDSDSLNPSSGTAAPSALTQWPVQLKLVHPQAGFLQDSHLLIAADCTAYAYARFHEDFLKGRTLLLGCPKLDPCDYTEKVLDILASNDIRSITVLRMEVPCCGGIVYAAEQALKQSGKNIPLDVSVISVEGKILPPVPAL